MKKFTSTILVLVMLCSLAVCGTVQAAAAEETDLSAFSEANIDWKKYEGTTIKAMFVQHWISEELIERIPEFEELTGITVNYEVLPNENDYRNKILIEFNSGGNPPDVIMENYAWTKTDANANWAADLYSYINDAEVTDAEFYDFDDFPADAIGYCKIGDKLPGLPITSERTILMYRKDLLEEKGIEVPTTFDELYDAAVALNDPENNISGFVSRLKRSSGAAHIFGNYQYSFGGKAVIENDDGTLSCGFNMPESIEAAEYYTKLLKDAGPQGAVNYGWSEALSEFQAGNAAFFADSSSFMGQIEDPETSQVVGKVGYANMPGDGVHDVRTHVNYWMLGLCEMGANKDAGWYFVQWATSKPVANEIQMENGNGARTSAWKDEAFIEKYGEEYVAAAMGVPGTDERYIVPQVDEMLESMDSVEIGLQRIYNGEDATEVMNDVQSEHEQFLGIG